MQHCTSLINIKNTILPVFLTQIQRPGQASSWARLVVPHVTQISQQEGSEPKSCGWHQHKASGLRLPLVVGLQLKLPQNLALRPRTLPPSRTKGGSPSANDSASSLASQKSDKSHKQWVRTGRRQRASRPVNLSPRLGVPLGLLHAEGLLLLAYLLQPLLLQEQHQGVPHVHHLDELLEDLLFFCLLLGGLVCRVRTQQTRVFLLRHNVEHGGFKSSRFARLKLQFSSCPFLAQKKKKQTMKSINQ